VKESELRDAKDSLEYGKEYRRRWKEELTMYPFTAARYCPH
jgi:hypothetical protein